MLQNRIYRGEIVHKKLSYPSEHSPIIYRWLWDVVQALLAGYAAQRNGTPNDRGAAAAFPGGKLVWICSRAVQRTLR